MKRLYVVPLLIFTLVTPALADTNQKTILVESMFQDANINEIFNGHSSNSISSLYKYSDSTFQNTLILAFLKANYSDGSLTSCGENLYYASLSEGNSYSINEIEDLRVETLSNGRIRAIAKVSNMDGYGIRDYTVKCDGNSCVITDAYQDDGTSTKKALGKYCN